MNKTQKYLIQYISRDIIGFISNDKNVSIDTAMDYFFDSRIFEILQDIESGLYTESASFVYELYKEEQDINT